ncbi:MAG: hypothetical protein JSW39_16135, partial [Desulfobacterales bacterium]
MNPFPAAPATKSTLHSDKQRGIDSDLKIDQITGLEFHADALHSDAKFNHGHFKLSCIFILVKQIKHPATAQHILPAFLPLLIPLNDESTAAGQTPSSST